MVRPNVKYHLALALMLLSLRAAAAEPISDASGEQRFRELYRELVETNTTLSSGSCTLAAARMATRLRAAGIPESDLHPFAAPDHPREGGLVAVYPGRDRRLKAILLLAHIDVVEARREDWTRDPFKLVEENGSFYARGAMDDKAEAAIWVDLLMRFASEKYRPLRTLKVALTCGEETSGAFNGAEWLTRNRRDLIDAGFAINEGGWGELDANGQRVSLDIEAGEKFPQNYLLEVTNPGGHSSRPVKNNAIYHLAAALTRIGGYDFPVQFNDANRAYFTSMAKIQAARGETAVANAMTAFLHDSNDAAAIALVTARDPGWNATLRTTCVATTLDGGHATNALPQRARANINCRILPDESAEQVRAVLERVVGDTGVKITFQGNATNSPPSPLTPALMNEIERVTKEMWPGVPVIPTMSTGATDGLRLRNVGIPVYGVSGLFYSETFAHGMNERIPVKAFYQGLEFMYRVVKGITGVKPIS